MVFETRDTETVEATAETTDQALEVFRRRVDALGLAEPTLTRSGENRIIVELPGVTDPDEVAETIGQTAQLSFHPVLGIGDSSETGGEGAENEDNGADAATAEDEFVLPDEDGAPLRLGPVALSGDAVGGAEGVLDQQTGTRWLVTVDFVRGGPDAWQQLTAERACFPPGDPQRRIAIVLDDQVISSPQVDPSV